MSFMPNLDPSAVPLGDRVAYTWTCGRDHAHAIECLWIWHDCPTLLGPTTVAPGEAFGWRPAGVGAHTLVTEHPLTISASVIWPACCGMHGFITDGYWLPC